MTPISMTEMVSSRYRRRAFALSASYSHSEIFNCTQGPGRGMMRGILCYPVLVILQLALSASLALPTAKPRLQLSLGDLAEPQVTQGVLIVAASALLVSELLILSERNSGHVVPTISQILRKTGTQANVVPFALSAMVTHWFLNHHDIQRSEAQARGHILLGLTLALALWDLKCGLVGATPAEMYLRNPPVLAVGIGLLAGYLLWPQSVQR